MATERDLVHQPGWSSRPVDGDPLSVLLSLLRAMWSRWWVVLLVAVPMVAGAWWYAGQLEDEYTSESIVVVEPRPEAGSATGPSVVRLKAPTYVAYVTADATTQAMDRRLGLERGTVADVFDAQVQSETGNIVVTATDRLPARAQEIAAAAAQELVDFSDDDVLLRAQLVAPPVVPDEPSGPPRTALRAAALLVALALGGIAAVAVERRRPQVETSADVEALTDYELLGRVPRRRNFPDGPVAAFRDPVIGTAVRSLRVRVAGDLPSGGAVTITSPVRSEGKTTIAALLATSFARTGVEVCLVDGDLRRPQLAQWLAAWHGSGLDRVLAGDATVEEAVVPGWTDHLSVLPTSPNAAGGESMAERMPDVIRALKETFELVLIDAPHVLGSDEARVLASCSDRVVLVVAAGTSQAALQESHSTLAGLRARVAGYVLNRISTTRLHDVGVDEE